MFQARLKEDVFMMSDWKSSEYYRVSLLLRNVYR